MKKPAFVIAAAIGASLLCTAAKPVTAIFSVEPPMVCGNCENRIKGELRFEKGIKDIRTDLKSQSVTICYDPAKTDTTALRAAFAKIGYQATLMPASSGNGK